MRRPVPRLGRGTMRRPALDATSRPASWCVLRRREWALLGVAIVTMALVAWVFEGARVPALALGGALAAIALRVALMRAVPEARAGGSGLPFAKARGLLRKLR